MKMMVSMALLLCELDVNCSSSSSVCCTSTTSAAAAAAAAALSHLHRNSSSSRGWATGATSDRGRLILHRRTTLSPANGLHYTAPQPCMMRAKKKQGLFIRSSCSRLSVSRDEKRCISERLRYGLLECGSDGLEQEGLGRCCRRGGRGRGLSKAIPQDTFWITAAQAVSLPLLLAAVTVITSLAIQMRFELDAMKQMEEMERLRAEAKLEEGCTTNTEDLLSKLDIDADDKVVSARSRNRPVREE